MAWKKQKITKFDAAERQTDFSVRMFFSDEDPIAIHTTTCAAIELIDDLAKAQGKPSILSSFERVIVVNRRKEVRELFRKPQNFLKHADKDHDEELEYNPEILELYLLFACNGYNDLTGKMTPEIRGFMIWFSLVHPNILNLPAIKSLADKYLKDWGAPKSDKDKLIMLNAVNQAKSSSGQK